MRHLLLINPNTSASTTQRLIQRLGLFALRESSASTVTGLAEASFIEAARCSTTQKRRCAIWRRRAVQRPHPGVACIVVGGAVLTWCATAHLLAQPYFVLVRGQPDAASS